MLPGSYPFLFRHVPSQNLFISVGNSTVDMREWPEISVYSYPPLFGISFVHAHMSEIWVRVCAPGNCEGTQFLGPSEETVLNDDPGGCIGHVGEFVVHADVTRGIDIRIRGL